LDALGNLGDGAAPFRMDFSGFALGEAGEVGAVLDILAEETSLPS
jgi:hypothetical protein